MRLAGALCLVLAPSLAVAEARLAVQGDASVVGERLDVQLRLSNAGTSVATELDVRARLGDVERSDSVTQSLEPGAELVLPFSWPVPREGTHPVLLRLAYHDGALGQEMQQPAWLLVGVGRPAAPCVSVSLPERVDLTRHTALRLSIASTDGEPHTVSAGFATADGLRVLEIPERIEVPAEGSRTLSVRLLRAGAPADTTQGLVAALTTLDGASAATTIATTSIDVHAPVRWTELLRIPGVVVGVLLLLLAAWFEWRVRRLPQAAAEPEPPRLP